MTDPERPLDPPEYHIYRCPVCGAAYPEQIISVPGGPVLGCNECLWIRDAEDYFEEE